MDTYPLGLGFAESQLKTRELQLPPKPIDVTNTETPARNSKITRKLHEMQITYRHRSDALILE